eukprot:SAG31_NODE_840_length_11596_cov_3.056623_4_plen_140_part_00
MQKWIKAFEFTQGATSEAATLMIESRGVRDGQSFLHLSVSKQARRHACPGARTSLQLLQLRANGLLALTLTDTQLLRLLAVIGILKNTVKKPTISDPNAVLTDMRAPLDPNTAKYSYPLHVNRCAIGAAVVNLYYHQRW